MHYVVSDVHGHAEELVAALRHAALLDVDCAWCGGQARLTFLGDYFDRGPDGIAVVDLIRRLQGEADTTGGRVDAMIGNHEILALGMSRFGDQRVPSERGSRSSFARSWVLNGGQAGDQQRLTEEHIAWLSGLDSIAVAGSVLLLHADTTEYLRWGDTIERINAAVREVLAGDDLEQWWECWARLTTRYAFAGVDGARGVPVAVGGVAHDAREAGAGLDAAAVVLERDHLDAGVAANVDVDVGQELLELHARGPLIKHREALRVSGRSRRTMWGWRRGRARR